MTPEHELWAMALLIEKQHGADGPRWIAQQIGRLTLEDDMAGVEMWKQVAARFQQLGQGGRPS